MGGAAQPAPAKPILADTGACRATAIISEQLSKKAQAMPNMSPAAKRFTEAWKAAYPDKETNVNGALGYNTYFLILDAIKRANSSDPKAIAKALAETKDLPTALGLLTINATHDAEMPVGIIEYKDGKRVYVGEVTPK